MHIPPGIESPLQIILSLPQLWTKWGVWQSPPMISSSMRPRRNWISNFDRSMGMWVDYNQLREYNRYIPPFVVKIKSQLCRRRAMLSHLQSSPQKWWTNTREIAVVLSTLALVLVSLPFNSPRRLKRWNFWYSQPHWHSSLHTHTHTPAYKQIKLTNACMHCITTVVSMLVGCGRGVLWSLCGCRHADSGGKECYLQRSWWCQEWGQAS